MFRSFVLLWFGLTLMKRLPPAPEWPDLHNGVIRLPVCRFCKAVSELVFGT